MPTVPLPRLVSPALPSLLNLQHRLRTFTAVINARAAGAKVGHVRSGHQDKKARIIRGSPSKVILLRNMVGPGEVDDDLEDEVSLSHNPSLILPCSYCLRQSQGPAMLTHWAAEASSFHQEQGPAFPAAVFLAVRHAADVTVRLTGGHGMQQVWWSAKCSDL